MAVTGIILAGGKSRRMGRDKTILKIEEQNLVENICNLTQGLFSEILIAGNCDSKFALPGTREIFDLYPGFGPLSGIHAGLSAAQNEVCFVLACDMPFINMEIIKTVLDFAPGFDVVIPRLNDHMEVLFGVYKKSCIPAIERMFRNHNYMVCDLYLDVKTRYLNEGDLAGLDLNQVFFNINTPDDYLTALGKNGTKRGGRQSINLEDAQTLLLQRLQPVKANQVELSEAFCHVLAEDVMAGRGYPFYDISAMDGYAVNSGYVNKNLLAGPVKLNITGTVNAGQDEKVGAIAQTETVAVMTGGLIPGGADTVIPEEDVQKHQAVITISSELQTGKFIIPAGNDFQKGAILAKRGSKLLPEAAALLNMADFTTVSIYGPVRAGLICVGDELIKKQNSYDVEKIPNSNGILLQALCQEIEAIALPPAVVADDAGAVAAAVAAALAAADIVITTGGTGNGGHDVIAQAFALLDCELLFNKIQIRPGASIWAWQKNDKLILCLPGTPGAVLVDFFLFAAPAIKKLQGNLVCLPQTLSLPLTKAYLKKHVMREMRNGRLLYREGKLWAQEERSQSQSRFALKADSNLLIDIPAGHESLAKGETVQAYLIRKAGNLN